MMPIASTLDGVATPAFSASALLVPAPHAAC